MYVGALYFEHLSTLHFYQLCSRFVKNIYLQSTFFHRWHFSHFSHLPTSLTWFILIPSIINTNINYSFNVIIKRDMKVHFWNESTLLEKKQYVLNVVLWNTISCHPYVKGLKHVRDVWHTNVWLKVWTG